MREFNTKEAIDIVRQIVPDARGLSFSTYTRLKLHVVQPNGVTVFRCKKCFTVKDVTLLALIAQFHAFGHSEIWLRPALRKVRAWIYSPRVEITPTVFLTTDGKVAHVYDCLKRNVVINTRRIVVTYPIGSLFKRVCEVGVLIPERKEKSVRPGFIKLGRWRNHGNAAWQALGR